MNPSTPEERRERVLNAMGSFALEGMYPSKRALAQARDYIAGIKTTTEIIDEIKARYTSDSGDDL